MKLIKKKNFQVGEFVICSPCLHWIFIIKSFLFFLLAAVVFFVGIFAFTGGFPVKYLYIFGLIKNLALFILLAAALVHFILRIAEYINIEYCITNKRILIKKGILNTLIYEMPINKIESVICTQGLLGILFKYGTIYVSGIGAGFPRFSSICKPLMVRRALSMIMEKDKAITIVQGEPPKLPEPQKPRLVNEEIFKYGTLVTMIKKPAE
jgi:membrane protein YdbS with pleckstrin-like domain